MVNQRSSWWLVVTMVIGSAVLGMGCGGPKDFGSRLAAEDPAEPGSVTILYWDNKNMGFGHIAVEVAWAAAAKPIQYVSYAMGNDYQVDRAKHGKDPVRFYLPWRSRQQMQAFEEWFASTLYADPSSAQYGSDYNILIHNCAHAILDVLRHLDYRLATQGEPWALRPVQVYRAALTLKTIEPAW